MVIVHKNTLKPIFKKVRYIKIYILMNFYLLYSL
jgi:hypothetical protein